MHKHKAMKCTWPLTRSAGAVDAEHREHAQQICEINNNMWNK